MKHIKIESIDDPRLTAYALGELDGDDLAAVEDFLATSDEARAEVEEIRAFATTLGDELAAEVETQDGAKLTSAQRATVESAVRGARVDATRGPARLLRLVVPLAAAAVVIVLARPWFVGGTSEAMRPAGAPALDAPVAQGEQPLYPAEKRENLWKARIDGSTKAPESDALGVRDESERLHQLGYLGGRHDDDADEPALGRDLESLGEAGDVATGEAIGVGGASGRGAGVGRTVARGGLVRRDAKSVEVTQPDAAPADGGEPGAIPSLAAGDVVFDGSLPPAISERSSVVLHVAPTPGAASATPARTAAPPAEDQADALAQLGYLGSASYVDTGETNAWQSRTVAETRHRYAETSNESYAPVHENGFRVLTDDDPLGALSTFGLDVDTASYANVRRFLTRNEAPPPDAVRLEELVNYFAYDDPAPHGDDPHPFAVTASVASAPWRPESRLVRIALHAEDDATQGRPPSNLVFLLDVSGSMQDADKLPLLKASLELLLRELDERDRVAIVTYADGSRVALPSTPCSDKVAIRSAIENLSANGSTHASAGIEEAYRVATENLREGGNNRVILATDGDFNVGLTDSADLQRFIEEKAKSGVFLTVLGFGTGNLKDSIAELLADRGNGNYAYIDTLNEAHKVLVEEMGGTLRTVAKDVKLQVEFNPARVRAYRLLGYENRALAARDFRDDRKDGGELGAGHSVVALYEVVPKGAPLPDGVDLRYRQVAEVDADALVASPDLLTVAVRYKLPDASEAREFELPLVDEGARFEQASDDFRFSAAVAAFGMILRRSEHRGDADLEKVLAWAEAAKGRDAGGLRAEFVRLVRTAQGIAALR